MIPANDHGSAGPHAPAVSGHGKGGSVEHQPHDPVSGTSEAQRIAELEQRIQVLERSLTRNLAELSKIQSSRWWRLASRYWRFRAGAGLVFSRLVHPLETLKVVAQRFLPVSLRLRLVQLIRRVSPARPHLSDVHRERKPEGGSSTPHERSFPIRPTILFLPAVPWDYRRQRPHHLATHLAALGWPVCWMTGEISRGRDAELGEEPAPGVRMLRVPAPTALNPLEGRIDDTQATAVSDALQQWQLSNRIDEVVIFCQSPYWAGLATRLKEQTGWPLLYDLIDLHGGFQTMLPGIVAAEQGLLRQADLVTVTSTVLEERAKRYSPRVYRIPNACEWERWSRPEGTALPASLDRPVIGYFGAISEWFDAGLVEFLAAARPHWSFVLIGSTWGGSVGRLEKMPNVHLLGEQPYERLPAMASGFDVGIIPFRDTPLTRATDPVKVYEMLALGLKVVATQLPELRSLEPHVELASTKEQFLACLDRAIRLPEDDGVRAARRALARENRWSKRAEALDAALTGLFPLVSIVIATYNNSPLTRMCLESIRSRTVYPNYEVIIVDNGSADGTPEALQEMASRWPALRILRNRENAGFAAATNQGVRVADGEIVVLLNNDTVVTRGWLCSMVRALTSHPTWGLVGAVTNSIGNEARIPVGYTELTELDAWAADYVWKNRGQSFPIGMVALFCAAVRRKVWQDIGELDERFEVGMFEDDDYCKRVRKAGLEIRCLRDCFVHHWHEASFRLLGDEEYQRIYETNRRRFLQKWSDPDPEQAPELERTHE